MCLHFPIKVGSDNLQAAKGIGMGNSLIATFFTLFFSFFLTTLSVCAAEEVSPGATSKASPSSFNSLYRSMTITFAENYPPFSWRNDQQEIEGILKDFLHEILEVKMQMEVEYHIYPWARGQKLVQDNMVDAFFSIPNPVRREYTEVSEIPIFISDYYMYTGMDNPNRQRLENLHSLEELKANTDLYHAYIVGGGWHGVNLGDVKNKWIEQDSKQILLLLQHNRADVYIEQRPLINFQIKKFGYKGKIVEIANKMDTTQWHLCIGKESPFTIILPELNALLDRLARSGELEQLKETIFSRYE